MEVLNKHISEATLVKLFLLSIKKEMSLELVCVAYGKDPLYIDDWEESEKEEMINISINGSADPFRWLSGLDVAQIGRLVAYLEQP